MELTVTRIEHMYMLVKQETGDKVRIIKVNE